MGKIFKQKKVKLVASIIFREDNMREKAEGKLRRLYGATEPLEKELPFDYTDYYSGEMGTSLKRKLICFKKLISKENVSKTKIRTNGIEGLFSREGKRTVNIDPGYITEAKLVLLTTKDYTHRIYVGKQIFAESTLYFCDGVFRSWPWTYPDYASEEMKSYFNDVRRLFIKQTGNKE